MRKPILLALLLGLMVGPFPAVAQTPPELIDVRKMWDEGQHNAFTDLIRHRDQWFCAFREGEGHVSADGAIRVLTSSDGEEWRSAARLTSETADLRDPKLSVGPDGRLWLIAAAAPHRPADGGHQPLVWTSADGIQWSEPTPVGERGFWLWRLSWINDRAYGVGYTTGARGNRFARLYESEQLDPIRFGVLVPRLFAEGDPSEATLRFDSDAQALCLLRRDGSEAQGTAQLGIAKPPYVDWTWRDLGVRFGGPNFLQLPDGRWIAAGRLYDGKVRTSICSLDPETGTLKELMALPSGGDSSYPGLIYHEGVLWMSYYSSHEGKTNIYLARVRL